MSVGGEMPQVSVVVPLYNEEGNIGPLQGEIERALQGEDYELVFVDDGSTDSTASRVRAGGRVRLLRLESNAGQSAAMHAGMRAARGRIIALLDGDLQNDPADLPGMLARVRSGEADLVCGYREKRRDTLSKRLTSRVANAVRRRFLGDGVRDTGCTLKAMRAECAEVLIPFRGMHRFIPAFVRRAGYRVLEVPVNHRARRHGESKYSFGNRAWRATMDMFGVRWLLSRQTRYRVSEGG